MRRHAAVAAVVGWAVGVAGFIGTTACRHPFSTGTAATTATADARPTHDVAATVGETSFRISDVDRVAGNGLLRVRIEEYDSVDKRYSGWYRTPFSSGKRADDAPAWESC